MNRKMNLIMLYIISKIVRKNFSSYFDDFGHEHYQLFEICFTKKYVFTIHVLSAIEVIPKTTPNQNSTVTQI